MFPIEQLHPMLLHFPIVLAYLLVLIDALALWRGVALDDGATYARFSLAVAVLAGLAAVATAMFGDMALDVAVSRGVPDRMMEIHQGLGTATATVLAVWAALRVFAAWRGIPLAGSRKSLLVVAELAFVALITFTAYHGGALVYDHAVNVAGAATGAMGAS
jgi:uncharacterized membrane protein